MAPAVSLCVVLFELAEDALMCPNLSYTAPKYRLPKSQRKNSLSGLEFKFGPGTKSETRGLRTPTKFKVKTFELKDEDEEMEEETTGLTDGATSNMDSDSEWNSKAVQFFSGNSLVEMTKGIIHLYKENDATPIENPEKDAPSEMLCILSVPAYISCRDLLQFLAPFRKEMDHIKVIRESTPNQYMALLKCKSESAAGFVYSVINGTPYSSLEEEICKVAFVSRVESLKDNAEIGLPLVGHTELPTCPVCLERMDESVDGILTILCNHTFHSGCLAKWSDARCPVCRYVQSPEMVAKNICFECGSSESLWICLICGHIGCGRYVHGHAYKHFCQTSHNYVIQPDNNRVWDYAGDNFVHRLLQNKDGKLVEQRRQNDDECEEEDKVDNLQLEYTYMLTSQLESQRFFYEEKMDNQAKEFRKEMDKLQQAVAANDKKRVEEELADVVKEKNALERKHTQSSQKLAKAISELKDEKEMNKLLQKDQQKWHEMVAKLETDFSKYKKEKETEITDLKEQLRDVMFYIEAQRTIEESPLQDEIVDGTVIVGEGAAGQDTSNAKGRRKKKH